MLLDPLLLASYDFTRDRRNIRPLEYLGDYQGHIHADAYSGYDELFRKEGVVEVGCWCHARRGFDEAMTSRPREVSEILGLIGRFYKLEKDLRERSPQDRQRQREATVRPIIDAIFKRIDEMKAATLPSEPLRKAIGNVDNQRAPLRCFFDDGRLEADNNTAENAIRPLAVGRKTGSSPVVSVGAGRRCCTSDSSSPAKPATSIPGPTSMTSCAASWPIPSASCASCRPISGDR